MTRSIDLHDQTVLHAEEVDNVRPDDLLPAEFEPMQASIAQKRPENILLNGLTLAQLARKTELSASSENFHDHSLKILSLPHSVIIHTTNKSLPPVLFPYGKIFDQFWTEAERGG